MPKGGLHILNNGGRHDGELCTYTMCYSKDEKVKDKCLGWCEIKTTMENKEIIHLYFGQKCIAKPSHVENQEGILCKVTGFPLRGTEYKCISEDGFEFWSFGFDIKLILRPLSSMTKEESIEYEDLRPYYDVPNSNEQRYYDNAESIKWLLSKGFDIFNLHESGQCLYE